MPFISYAQNLEDVMLHRVFGDISEGFYIDVGAQEPVLDSITKAFYDKGWHGINIEPCKIYYDKLCKMRPRDINLNLAAGEHTGISTFYEIPDTGLSTLDKKIAEMHAKVNYHFDEKTTPVLPLSEICQQLVKEQTIHFLKIDVEGYEKFVLAGMNFEKFRPYVVIVEATIPLSTTPSYAEWEFLLLQQEYDFVYFDGANRFYLAKEKADLKSKFDTPVNVFDDYIRATENISATLQHRLHNAQKLQVVLKNNCDQLREEVDTLRTAIRAHDKELEILKEENHALKEYQHTREAWIAQILASRSWTITKPLREFSAFVNTCLSRNKQLPLTGSSQIQKSDSNFIRLLKEEIEKRKKTVV